MFEVVGWSGLHDKRFVLEQYPTHVWWCSRLYNEVVHTMKHLFLNNIQHMFEDVWGCMMKWFTQWNICSWTTSNTSGHFLTYIVVRWVPTSLSKCPTGRTLLPTTFVHFSSSKIWYFYPLCVLVDDWFLVSDVLDYNGKVSADIS